jgi:hypothetical protein
VARGFDLLDADHHALDGLIAGYTDKANALLSVLGDRQRLGDARGAYGGTLDRFAALIGRHLDDEEDLVVPVILRHAEALARAGLA